MVTVGTGGLMVGGSDGRSDSRYGRSEVELVRNSFAGDRGVEEDQTCHICGKKGHLRAQCRVRKEDKRP